MRRKIKGFTLIECLVALAILGVASLTMAQIYATVSMRNKMNHLVNTSLANQMAYVERYTNSEAVQIPSSSTGNTIEIVRVEPNASGTGYNHIDDESYTYPVDVYVLKSRDRNDQVLTASPGDAGYTESNDNLRYKYLLGGH